MLSLAQVTQTRERSSLSPFCFFCVCVSVLPPEGALQRPLNSEDIGAYTSGNTTANVWIYDLGTTHIYKPTKPLPLMQEQPLGRCPLPRRVAAARTQPDSTQRWAWRAILTASLEVGATLPQGDLSTPPPRFSMLYLCPSLRRGWGFPGGGTF